MPRYFFSDSADVLYWLWSESVTQQKDATNFVGNRLKKIGDVSKGRQWYHVGSKENPADIASRGETLSKLNGNTFWFQGTDFIKEEVIKSQTKIDRKKMPFGVHRELGYVNALIASVNPKRPGLKHLISLDYTNDF